MVQFNEISFLIEDIASAIRQEMYVENWDNTEYVYYNTEKAFRKIANKYRFDTIDAYGSFVGKYLNIPEFFVPNAYGQEDCWDSIAYKFDFIMLFEHKVFIAIQYKHYLEVLEQPFSVNISMKNFGGKRGYYFKYNEYVQFRAEQDFYKELPDKYKFPEGENDLSGPHFTIRFDSNIKKYILKEK